MPLLVGVTAGVSALLALTLYGGDRGYVSWSPAVILAVALLLRLMFLFAPPQLSDDIYRYLWDGSVLLRGDNPYAAAPAAVQPPPGLAAVHGRINHPEYVTIYPPAAQLVFAGGAFLGSGVTGLKGLLVALDLLLCALIMRLLQRLELPAWRTVLYAWNPLPVLEIAGSGHLDGAGLTLFLGACCLLLAERQTGRQLPLRTWPYPLAGVLLAAAGLIKLFPLVLAPLLFLLTPRSRRPHLLAGLLGGMAALLLPFLPHLAHLAATLDAYARNWEFAGFAFAILRRLTGSGTISRLLLSSGFLLLVASIARRTARGCSAGAAPAVAGRRAMAACYAIALGMLLLTPTLHPWYALCLAVFLPFAAGPAGLVLCWAVFLTYRVQIPFFILGQWLADPTVSAAVFLAPLLAYVLGRLFRTSRTTGP